MRIKIFIQARMGSTRLPGKVLKPILGKPMLHYLLERAHRVRFADELIVLTTTQPEDEQIVNLCKQEGVSCFQGPEDDVLARFHQAAAKYSPDAIVRITADCPLVDPAVIDHFIQTYDKAFPEWDYISNCLVRTFPRGYDVEIFSKEALDKAFNTAAAAYDREHVTPYIYTHPKEFQLHNIGYATDLSKYRLTVDTPEDFELIQLIFEHLYPIKPEFTLKDVVELLQKHPTWL